MRWAIIKTLFEREYSKAYKETADFMLFYPDYKADFENSDIDDARDDIIYASPLPTNPEAGKNSVRAMSDPTGSKGIKLAQYDRSYIARWLELCEDSEKSFPIHLRVFLQLRREYRNIPQNQGWTNEILGRFPSELAARLNVPVENIEKYRIPGSRRTLHEWWRRIVHVTMWEAANRKLIKD